MFPGGALFCEVSRELSASQTLLASLLRPPPGSTSSPPLGLTQPSVKEEPLYPAALHSDIQLLPQQAGMAAILATAVVNSEYSGPRAGSPHCCGALKYHPRPLGASAAPQQLSLLLNQSHIKACV